MNNKFPEKIKLANLPTPLQQINFDNKKFYIKRDDLTGVELTGNKVRKLEYLLFKAKQEKADYVFTCGGDQSNHARATAIAAASLGIKSKLFLWGKDSSKPVGNLFLNKFIGSEIHYLNKKEFLNAEQIMYQEKIRLEKLKKKVFQIPAGGSSSLGIWGYINFVKELKNQISKKEINGITTACGSGGTAAGLLIGSHLNNLNLKICAVNVLFVAKDIKEIILDLAYKTIEEFKLKIKLDENRLEIFDGYSTEGYKNISDDKILLIKNFAQQTGIILDPAYTGKAFKAFNEIFLVNNKTSKNLFLHTGGIFGVFNKISKYISV